MNRRKLLIVVDCVEDRSFPVDVLGSFYDMRSVETGGEAIACLQKESYDLLIAPLHKPGSGAGELIAEVRSKNPNTVILAVTDGEDAGEMERARMLGAEDCIEKPFLPEKLKYRLDRAVRIGRLRRENRALQAQLADAANLGRLLGDSEAMRRIKDQIRLVAPTQAAVLISGESGTGKKLVAGEIHRWSERSGTAFLRINCASMPEALLETQLFGQEKGAFPGAAERICGKVELADGGTLLLEEVGALTLTLQAKLLGVLREGELDRGGAMTPLRVDTRVIATTTSDLEKEIAAGTFLEELFFRLNVVPIHVPPLRERREDIPLLLDHYLAYYAERHGKKAVRPARGAMRKLCSAEWKGNVRALENRIERAVIMGNGEVLEEEFFAVEREDDDLCARMKSVFRSGSIRDMEKLMILSRLRDLNDNRTHAAKSLGVSVRTLRNKLHEYNPKREPVEPAGSRPETEEELLLIPG